MTTTNLHHLLITIALTVGWPGMYSADLSRSDIEAYYHSVTPDAHGTGDQWRARCPVHNGSSPTSLAIDLATGRWFCHSQCGRGGDVFGMEQLLHGYDDRQAYNAVYQIIGRTPPPFQGFKSKPLGEARQKFYPWRITATYVYQDENRNALYRAVRKEKAAVGDAKPEKRFSLETPKDGGWSSVAGNMEGVRRIPYRLPELLEAKSAGTWIWIVEGEKAVEALVKLRLTATCNPQGAGKWPKYRHELNPPFVGAKVLILPDNDDPGRKHALTVADNLLSIASSVKILDLPDLPEKGDVVDWIAAGGADSELIRSGLIRLAKATPALDIALFEAYIRQWTPAPEKKRVKAIESNELPWEPEQPASAGPSDLDDSEDATEDASKAHQVLTRILGTEFLRFVQVGIEEPSFRLETRKGNVRFEHMGQIITEPTFNRLAGPVLDRCISFPKKSHWNIFGSRLLAVKVVEQPDPESQPSGSTKVWLVEYLQRNQCHSSWEDALSADDPDSRELPHFEGDAIWIAPKHAVKWCLKHLNLAITYKRLSEILTDKPFHCKRIQRSIRKPKSNITFYRLPEEFQASDYRIELTPQLQPERAYPMDIV